MSAEIIPGAEPMSASGGPDGVLVLHGYTGNPNSMRGIAEQLADAGLTVELPLLPGHGASVEDLVPMRWEDWHGAAEAAYAELAAHCARVVVVGLSMGGSLTTRLAIDHPEIAAIVLVNPLVEPPADDFIAAVRGLLDSGTEVAPGIGSDIAKPGVVEISYDGTPLAAVLSLFDAVAQITPRLGEIRCPVLLFSSREDHVVPPPNGDLVEKSVGGPCERIHLERSFHVATLDWDREEIEERTREFVLSIFDDTPTA